MLWHHSSLNCLVFGNGGIIQLWNILLGKWQGTKLDLQYDCNCYNFLKSPILRGEMMKHSNVKGLGLHGKNFIAFFKIVLCSSKYLIIQNKLF